MAHIVLQERRVATTKKNHPFFWKNLFRQSQSTTPQREPKRQKPFLLRHIRVDTPLFDTINQKFSNLIIFYTLSLQ